MMKSVRALVAVAITSILCFPADARQKTNGKKLRSHIEVASYPNKDIKQFDPALGTLERVEWSVEFYIDAEWEFYNNSSTQGMVVCTEVGYSFNMHLGNRALPGQSGLKIRRNCAMIGPVPSEADCSMPWFFSRFNSGWDPGHTGVIFNPSNDFVGKGNVPGWYPIFNFITTAIETNYPQGFTVCSKETSCNVRSGHCGFLAPTPSTLRLVTRYHYWPK